MQTPTPLELGRLHFAASMGGETALGAFNKYQELLERRRSLRKDLENLDADVFVARRELNFQIAQSAVRD